MPVGNIYPNDVNQTMGQPTMNGIQSQGNSYNSRAALKSQINSANGHGNNTASKQSLKNVQASSQLMNSSENTISTKTQDLKQG